MKRATHALLRVKEVDLTNDTVDVTGVAAQHAVVKRGAVRARTALLAERDASMAIADPKVIATLRNNEIR